MDIAKKSYFISFLTSNAVPLHLNEPYMEEEIRHQGIVESVSGSTVSVRILQTSACAGCQVKNLCRASESKEKVIEIEEADAQKYAEGQQVTVAGTASQGMKAVILACGVPTLLLILTIAVSNVCGVREAVAALIGIGILVPYFLVLYLLRDRLKTVFRFKIID